MKNSLLHTAILLVLSSGLAAAADKPAAPAMPVPTGTQAQLDELNAENALLTVELKNVELKDKIKNGGQSSQTSSTPGLSMPSLPGIKSMPAHDDSVDAKVVLVSGAPGHAVATIIMNGATIKASPGKYIRGLGTVKSVSLDEVVIQNRKNEFTLPFVEDKLSAPTGAGNMGNTMPIMPPMMPMGAH